MKLVSKQKWSYNSNVFIKNDLTRGVGSNQKYSFKMNGLIKNGLLRGWFLIRMVPEVVIFFETGSCQEVTRGVVSHLKMFYKRDWSLEKWSHNRCGLIPKMISKEGGL